MERIVEGMSGDVGASERHATVRSRRRLGEAWRRLGPWLAAFVLVAAGCTSATFSRSAPSSRGDLDRCDLAEIQPATRDVFRFESFPEMVATADAVVVATVKGIEPGPTWPPEAGSYRQWFVGIDVEETLSGSVPARELGLVVDDVVIFNPLLECDGRDWWTIGTRSVFFLRDWADDGFFGLLNSHSIYILADGDLRPVYDGGLAAAIGRWSLDELRAEVAKAAAAAAAGEVTPQPIRRPGQAP